MIPVSFLFKKEVSEDFYCFGEKKNTISGLPPSQPLTTGEVFVFTLQPRCNRHHQDDIKIL